MRGRIRPGLLAAGATLTACGAVAAAGAAGAAREQAADATFYISDNGTQCFTLAPGEPACGGVPEVNIETGDQVTWNFDGSNSLHNAAADNQVPADPAWSTYAGPFVDEGSYSRTFNQPGDYQFLCQAHPVMVGVIHVTGEPVETPTPTPTQTATPTPTSTATPTPTPSVTPTPTQPGGGGGPITTPPPTGGAGSDTTKPTISRVRVKALRRAARVRFTLSEPASVTVRIRRGRRTVKTSQVHAAAGTRSVTVRSRKLKKGRYVVQLSARDAAGNRSALATKALRIRR